MARNARPRKAYRPRAVQANAHQVAMAGVCKLLRPDVERQVHLLAHALQALKSGHDALLHWRSLADAANVAETLAGLGIGSGPDAQALITAGQAALSAVVTRQQQGGGWALRAQEVSALHWLAALHANQLRACDYSEFSRALDITRERITQARAGNAPADAVIVTGELA